MPGSIFELQCPGCQRIHKLETGESLCHDHGERWRYEQWVCERCELIISLQSSFCCREGDSGCPVCGAELRRWEGRVWFDYSPEGFPDAEHVAGPCPRCQTMISEADGIVFGDWD